MWLHAVSADLRTGYNKLCDTVPKMEQEDRERAIQSLCHAVWSVQEQQYTVSGKCGDRKQYTVNHQYSQQVAVVDAAKFDALKAEMAAHLTFATKEVASAILEHSLAEERLSAFVLHHVLSNEGPPALARAAPVIHARQPSRARAVHARFRRALC